MASARDEFLNRLALSATPQDWDVVREVINEEPMRRSFLIWDRCRRLRRPFNAARVARRLGVDAATVRRWIRTLEAIDDSEL